MVLNLKIPRYKKQDTNKLQITSTKFQRIAYHQPLAIQQSRERLDSLAT